MITDAPDELELNSFFSSSLETWPGRLFNTGDADIQITEPKLAHFVTCFEYPSSNSMAVWIRQGEGLARGPIKDDRDRLVEEAGLHWSDTAIQRSDVVFVERRQNGRSGSLPMNDAAVIGAQILGSAQRDHRHCEIHLSFNRIYFFSEIQRLIPERPLLAKALICYWEGQDRGRAVDGF